MLTKLKQMLKLMTLGCNIIQTSIVFFSQNSNFRLLFSNNLMQSSIKELFFLTAEVTFVPKYAVGNARVKSWLSTFSHFHYFLERHTSCSLTRQFGDQICNVLEHFFFIYFKRPFFLVLKHDMFFFVKTSLPVQKESIIAGCRPIWRIGWM